MIYDAATDAIVGNLGWVDRGSLWVFALNDRSETEVAIEGASYLSLGRGPNGLFRVVHHHSPDLGVSIRHIAHPALELASIRFDGSEVRFAGDAALWSGVDPSAIIQTDAGPRLVWIDGPSEKVTYLDLSWFTSANYDLGYQGIVDCLSLPDAGLVAVSIQRSSELVLIDPARNQRVGQISLAGRGGNPTLSLRSGMELLASDYDSLCVVNAKTGAVRSSGPLEAPPAPNTQQFIGDYDARGAVCAVARPFSGDVLLLDLATFGVRTRAPVSGQPLVVCMTSGSRFVTRDWKTGRVEVGRFSE
jgi:hypothetical protein